MPAAKPHKKGGGCTSWLLGGIVVTIVIAVAVSLLNREAGENTEGQGARSATIDEERPSAVVQEQRPAVVQDEPPVVTLEPPPDSVPAPHACTGDDYDRDE